MEHSVAKRLKKINEKEQRGRRQQKLTDTKTHKLKSGRKLITMEYQRSLIVQLFQNILQLHIINGVLLYGARSYTVNNKVTLCEAKAVPKTMDAQQYTCSPLFKKKG